jgi:UPF0755 protein
VARSTFDPDSYHRRGSIAAGHDQQWDDEWDGEWEHDDGFVYVPEERGVGRKVLSVGTCLIVFVFLVLGLSGYWLYSQVNPTGGSGEPVELVIPKDAGLPTISRLLEEKEIISNATIFRYYVKWKSMPSVKAGTYDGFHKHESMDAVVARLAKGPLPTKFTDVTIPEGLWPSDTLTKILEKLPQMNQAELANTATTVHSKFQPDGKGLDGFLFPATYRVSDGDRDNEVKLIGQMVNKFDDVGDEVGLAGAAAKLNGQAGKTAITSYDALIVASLIEGEAKVPEDRPKIARVIYNRLKANQPLGIDAALFVALGKHTSEITASDLEIDSPYNLRKNPGLPPSPINSPGKESLIAALNPSDPSVDGADKWMYYVLADKAGHHFFTGDYNEFLREQKRARDAGLL